jgi:hypothetical protein
MNRSMFLSIVFLTAAHFTMPEPVKAQPPERIKVQARIGLDWISRTQQKDGSWGMPNGVGTHQVATTSFCALALLASGDKKFDRHIDLAAAYVANNLFGNNKAILESPQLKEQARKQMAEIRAAKKKALDELVKSNPQLADAVKKLTADDADVGDDFSLDDSNWRLALGGAFLCEYYAAAKRKNRKASVDIKLIDKLASECVKRMGDSGGWGHGPGKKKNALGYLELEIMSNWMLITLGDCQRLGCKNILDKEIDKAITFIEQCCKEKEGGVGYSPRFGQKGIGCPCRTGAAIFAFGLLEKTEHPLYPLMRDYWEKHYSESVGAHGSASLGLLGSALGARQLGKESYDSFAAKCFPKVLDSAKKDGTFEVIPERTPEIEGGKSFKWSFSVGTGSANRFHFESRGQALDVGIYTLTFLLERENLTFLGRRFE